MQLHESSDDFGTKLFGNCSNTFLSISSSFLSISSSALGREKLCGNHLWVVLHFWSSVREGEGVLHYSFHHHLSLAPELWSCKLECNTLLAHCGHDDLGI